MSIYFVNLLFFLLLLEFHLVLLDLAVEEVTVALAEEVGACVQVFIVLRQAVG